MNATEVGDLGVGELMLIVTKALSSIVLQFSLAIALTYKGVITKEHMKGFSEMLNYILVPTVSFVSIGSQLNPEQFLSEGWILAVMGVVTCFEAAILAIIMRPLAKPTPEFSRLFVVMMALPNIIALPIEISKTFCQLGVFAAEYDDETVCIWQANLYVFMYVSLSSFCIWIVFANYLTYGLENPDLGEEILREPKSAIRSYIVDPLQYFVLVVIQRPPVLGAVLGLLVGLVPWLQQLIFSNNGGLAPVGFAATSLAAAAVPFINLVMACSIGLKLKEVKKWRHMFDMEVTGAEPRTVVVSVVLRGIVLPFLHLLMLYLLAPMFPENRLFRFVLVVTAICPTASIVVILAHVCKLEELANTAAFMIVPQYLLSLPTVTGFLLLALYVIG